MNIKEVEQLTGLPRSNIRFYEKEGLVIPKRNEKNGYREYSDHNVSVIKKIAYLRTLGFSVDEIRKIMDNRLPLSAAVENQVRLLDSQISELANARAVSYTHLDVYKRQHQWFLGKRRSLLCAQLAFWSEHHC